MAGSATVITADEARDVYGFEVRQSETREAAKIVIVPARVIYPECGKPEIN